MSSRPEPANLVRGKKFHRTVQEEWLRDADGPVFIEHGTTKPNGRRGRMDVYVSPDEGPVAVCEIKASDWDAMTERNVKRNVRRQIKQIWDYIETELEKANVSAGIIFPRRPTIPGRLKQIEDLFNDEGIQVVWQDETIGERKAH